MATENQKEGPMKHIPLAIALLALAAALFAIAMNGGAAGQPQAAMVQQDSFDRIVADGRITACYVTWPPSVTKDPNTGEVSGFIIDMFGKIANDASLKVDYVESTWGGFPADLNSGRCDVGVAGIYPLISRSTSVSFTRPYLYSGNGVVKRTGDSRFKSVSDLNQKGVKVAVIQGEYGHIYAKKYLPNAELVVLEKGADPTMPIISVSSGQADAGMSLSDVIGEYVKLHPEVQDINGGKPFATEPATFAVRHGDLKLKNFLDNGLSYLESTGYTEAAVRKYNSTYWYKADVQYVEVR